VTKYKIEIRGRGSVVFDVNESSYSDEDYETEADYITKFFFFVRDSYSFFYGEFSHRMMCFMKLQERIQGRYTTYLDMLGGLGCTGKIYGQSLENTFLNEWNDACVAGLKKNFSPENIFQHDGTTFPFDGRRFDVTLADFSNFTLKKFQERYHPFVTNMLANTDRFAVITDCSNFYLKYGESSYKTYERYLGPFEHTLEGFYRAYANFWAERYPGWKLIGVEYFRASGYLLLEKTEEEPELKINFNTKEDLAIYRPLTLFKAVGEGETPDIMEMFGDTKASDWKELR